MSDAFSVCVYCGSRDGANPAYAVAAETVGAAIAQQGWRLIYGAGDIGLMGKVARAAQAGGGPVMGIIPAHLMELEVGRVDLSQFIVTETMHERKKVMFVNADAVVVMPGGAGSLDEFFEVLTWRQIGLHKKPIFLLNIHGYWDPLITLVDHVIDQGFADGSLRGFFSVKATPAELIDALRATRS